MSQNKYNLKSKSIQQSSPSKKKADIESKSRRRNYNSESSDSDDDDYDDEYDEDDSDDETYETETTPETESIDSADYKEYLNYKKNLDKKKTFSPVKKNYTKSKERLIEDDKDEDYDNEDESEDYGNKKNNKINILFSINDEGDDNESDWEDMEDSDTENEDESVSSASESEEEQEQCNEEDEEHYEDEEEYKKKSSKKLKKNGKKIVKKDIYSEKVKKHDILELENSDGKTDEEILFELEELFKIVKNKKMLKECIDIYKDKIRQNNRKIEKKMEKQKEKNSRIFKKIIRDKNVLNDYAVFKKYPVEKQISLIKEMKKVNELTRIETPYRLSVLELKIPPIFKSIALKKISIIKDMDSDSNEYYKIKNWVDTFMRIPFGKYQELPINITHGSEECHKFLERSKNILNEAVYGMNQAKMQILQLMGQLIANPKSIGNAIALTGEKGVGKTSLIKEGVSKMLGMPFTFIALGGATDSSYLEGHGYTYEGSLWGKIVQVLLDSQCMNPIIYFDELDKISDTPKGEEITNILIHLIDTTQNNEFTDKFFTELHFDLSRCMFIFSYNDETKVNPILLDRMYKIKVDSYTCKDKLIICNKHLLPKIREQIRFSEEDIIIPDDVLAHIIENYTESEGGVRNIKRCLEIIYSKLNLFRLMREGENLFKDELDISISFPITITKNLVDKLIKKNKGNMNYLNMYI